MNQGSRALQVIVWGLLAIVLLAVVVVFLNASAKRSSLPKYGEVKDFTLTNQLGQTVTLADLKGKVWVADVIFTSCAGPCPKMTDQMAQLQNAFPADAPLRFVSITTHPQNDTPSELKAYSEKFSADPSRWHFLTGTMRELLQNLAIGSLKLTAVEKEKELQQDPNDLFIHSTMFVLVDKRGQVRGFYESLEPGFQEKIRGDIRSLLAER
ncbi:MAG TPA: SCO family protein [Verrucomicrobiae bacterium]